MSGNEDVPVRKRISTDLFSGTSRNPLRGPLLAFCLTVLVVGGGTQAFGYWNQSATMTMQVTAELLQSPTITCKQGSTSQSVVVTWVPQQSGVTSYAVTVSRDGTVVQTTTYQPGTTSETVKAPDNFLASYTYTYSVTVKAHYGSWQAPAAELTGIAATKNTFSSARISCPSAA